MTHRSRTEPDAPGIDGGLLLVLALYPADWIRRRVEVISFEGVSSIRREVSVDFTTSFDFPEVIGGHAIPLARLRKQVLRSFSLRDEDGRPVPVLSTRENGDLTWSLLLASAESVVGAPPPAPVADDLRHVAFTPSKHADSARWWAEKRPSEGAYRDAAFGDPWFASLTEEYSHDFQLMGVLPDAADGKPERRVVKYGYSESVDLTPTTLRAKLGWEPVELSVDIPLVGHCESYHIEFVVPEGLKPVYAELAASDLDPSAPDAQSQVTVDSQGDRPVHLNVGGVGRFATGFGCIQLLPTTSGLVRQAWLVSTGIAVLLLACFAFAGTANNSDTNSAVTLLIAGPGILAALVVRPGEHALASYLLRTVRWLVVAAAVAAFAAAIGVAAKPETDAALRWWLIVPVLVAAASAATLTRTLWVTWRALPLPAITRQDRHAVTPHA